MKKSLFLNWLGRCFLSLNTCYLSFLFVATYEIFLFCLQSQRQYAGDWKAIDIIILFIFILAWGCFLTFILDLFYYLIHISTKFLQEKSAILLPSFLIALLVSYVYIRPIFLLGDFSFLFEDFSRRGLFEFIPQLFSNLWDSANAFFLGKIIFYYVIILFNILVLIRMRSLYFSLLFPACVISIFLCEFLFPITLSMDIYHQKGFSNKRIVSLLIYYITFFSLFFILYHLGVQKYKLLFWKHNKKNYTGRGILLLALIIIGFFFMYKGDKLVSQISLWDSHSVYIAFSLIIAFSFRALLYKIVLKTKNLLGLSYLAKENIFSLALTTYKLVPFIIMCFLLSLLLTFPIPFQESNTRISRYRGLGKELMYSLGIVRLNILNMSREKEKQEVQNSQKPKEYARSKEWKNIDSIETLFEMKDFYQNKRNNKNIPSPIAKISKHSIKEDVFLITLIGYPSLDKLNYARHNLALLNSELIHTLQILKQDLNPIEYYYEANNTSFLSSLNQKDIRTICIFNYLKEVSSYRKIKLDSGCQIVYNLSNQKKTESFHDIAKKSLSYYYSYKENSANFVWLHHEIQDKEEDNVSIINSISNFAKKGKVILVLLNQEDYKHLIYISYKTNKLSHQKNGFVDMQKIIYAAYDNNINIDQLDNLKLVSLIENHHSFSKNFLSVFFHKIPIPTLLLDQRGKEYYLLIDHLSQATQKIPKTINTIHN